MWTEAVVIEVEVAEGNMGGEECDKWRLHVETESVIVHVDGVEVWEVEESGEKVGEGSWDLGEHAAGEDISQVGNLKVH